MQYFKYIFTAFFLITLLLSACRKDEFITDNSAKVSFSIDTLRFDTVFTQVGSATRFLKIKNPHNQPIKISKIYLAQGTQSYFNLNIDGVAGDEQENIEIPANDSIYVFAEVTINPNDKNNPFVINEDLVVETNGNTQKVILEAWGQNANYIPNNTAKGKIAALTADAVWNDPKPYVIYGILVIDGVKLTIAAGTRIHIHGGLVRTDNKQIYSDGMIYVQNGGEIEIQGTKSQPVVIQGDRLEKPFEKIPAQWNLIYFGANTKANFSYTTIKNARLGLYADSASTANLKYCQIYNTAGPGIYARQADITLDNCLLHSNGDRSFVVNQGGSYQVNYSTIANFGANTYALELSNAFCRAFDAAGNCVSVLVSPLNFNAQNSIFHSSQRDAISLVEVKNVPFNYYFQNSIVRVQDLIDKNKGGYTDFFANCKSCINITANDKLFKKIDADNYRLDTLSIAENKALPINGLTEDLDGTPRDAQKPDIGAYEFKPK
jgi:hypothetical protein